MKRIMKHEIIRDKLPEYIKATKKEKGIILSNVMAITKMPSKSLIRAFNREQKRSHLRSPPHLGRPKLFTTETEAALAFIWEQFHSLSK